MEIIVISKEDFEIMKASLIKEISNILLKDNSNQPKEWIRTSEVCKILKISNSSVQNLRNSGSLPFSKIKGTIYYKAIDIEKLLESNLKSNLE